MTGDPSNNKNKTKRPKGVKRLEIYDLRDSDSRRDHGKRSLLRYLSEQVRVPRFMVGRLSGLERRPEG